MSDTVIKVENLGKKYIIGHQGKGSYKTFREQVVDGVKGFFSKTGGLISGKQMVDGDEVEEFWALQGLNFEIGQGERVGIIGRNGAGKSTLLKVLSRITEPSTGKISIKGRVASLLEVGTGFHPELTGRENIYLNGAIMGMSRAEIKRKFDEIVDFSGVEKFLDTPVKRYSSGMYVRLAFSVAAHLEPEILVVDEVLAVGDAEFQKKCLGKMQDVSKNDGRTILFVSHSMPSIRQLCKNAILLNEGMVEYVGTSDSVIKHYFQQGREISSKPTINNHRTRDISDSPVFIENIYLDGYENERPILPLGSEIEVTVRIKVIRPISDANISFGIYNSEGVNIGIAFSRDDNFVLTADEGTHEIRFKLSNVILPPNEYLIGVGLNQSDQSLAWDVVNLYPLFFIENQSNIEGYANRTWGTVHLCDSKWQIKKLN